jgi:hypothetical protein
MVASYNGVAVHPNSQFSADAQPENAFGWRSASE